MAKSKNFTDQEVQQSVEYVNDIIKIVDSDPNNIKASLAIVATYEGLFGGLANKDAVARARLYTQIAYYVSSWTRSLLKLKSADELMHTRKPAFIIYSEDDLQVPPADELRWIARSCTDYKLLGKHVVILVGGVDHFFRNRRGELSRDVLDGVFRRIDKWLLENRLW